MFSCRRTRPREREVQIHLRRPGPHFHRIGWLNRFTKYLHPLSNYLYINATIRSLSTHIIDAYFCHRIIKVNMYYYKYVSRSLNMLIFLFIYIKFPLYFRFSENVEQS